MERDTEINSGKDVSRRDDGAWSLVRMQGRDLYTKLCDLGAEFDWIAQQLRRLRRDDNP